MIIPKQKERYLGTFLIALGVSVCFFLPFLIKDQGYFLFYGDFNVQQIPFYQMCHDAVRRGDLFWNWYTDLGVNFIGSYSFYLLGSPFFWLTIPFPSWMVPYLMGPLLILKFACSALTAYCLLRRLVKYRDHAMLGALLYAFSGFSVYNIFFNHFHEAIVFFPLLLLALELYVTERRRGVFALAVALCAVSNYFFFFGMCVFLVIYWFVRILSGSWQMRPVGFLWLIFEALLGVALAAFLLLPSYFSVIQNSRAVSPLTGWGMLLYGRPQIFLNIIQTFFFPPDIPARPVFFPDADVKWASLGGWLPLFGMTGVIAWLQTKKGNWLRRMILILAFMALVPILNSSFYMFNYAYYARWFYMPILLMSLATVKALEEKQVDWSSALRWSAGITLAFTVGIGLLPTSYSDGKFSGFGLYNRGGSDADARMYRLRFWATCAIALASLLALALLLWAGRFLRRQQREESDGSFLFLRRKVRQRFLTLTVGCVCVVTVLYSVFFIACGKSHSYDEKGFIIPHLLQGEIDLPEEGSPRVDVYKGMDNTAMFFGLPELQAFHSIVPRSIMKFYPYVGVERSVGSRPETSVYSIRSLLNVKYLLDYRDSSRFSTDERTEMPGWEYYDTQNGFDIYENQYSIPYGFTYDYYVTNAQADGVYSTVHDRMLLRAILLDDEQVRKYGNMLENLPEQALSSFTQEEYFTDCRNRQSTAEHNTFSRDNLGFTSTVELPKENLVFYAVPYEDGWSATVDGVPVEVEQVNVGFMAVAVPAGKHTVRFDYRTPGLSAGLIVTAAGAALYALYLLGWCIYRRRRGREEPIDPEREAMLAEYEREERAVSDYEETLRYASAPQGEDPDGAERQPIPPAEPEPEELWSGGFDGGFGGFGVVPDDPDDPPEDLPGRTQDGVAGGLPDGMEILLPDEEDPDSDR